MIVLRMRAAAHRASGGREYGPFDIELRAGDAIEHDCASTDDAAMFALLAAAITRPTSGTVTIADFDSRIQPAQCKRVTGYVAHDPLPMSLAEFEHHLRYRSALWNVDAAQALSRAHLALSRLAGVHEAFAYPVAAALMFAPSLVVFDRPPVAYAQAMIAAAAPAAVLVARG